jgi:uncharacterized protein YjbJ (UPF0337 family)
MNKQQVKGVTNQATGEIKKQVGHLTGDSTLVAKGEAREIKGKLQEGVGDAKEAAKDNQAELDARSKTPRP